MNAVKFKNNRLFYLDQTELPLRELWRECKSLKDGFWALKTLSVRGAPLIGVFSAYCLAISLKYFSLDKEKFLRELGEAVTHLKSCRPTAVNLSWALERLERVAQRNKGKPLSEIKKAVISEVREIHKEDIILCKRLADYGVKLVKKGDRILTHCNTGFLATAGEGTALAVIYEAHKKYKHIHVYVDETRPLLQGARLTTWELTKRNVPCTLISDNMAAYLMQKNRINKVFVGADRIAANGDVANKIGTYNLAVIAHYHKVPFYVVAPQSSFDLSASDGKCIPIEERNPDELRKVFDKIYIAPKDIAVFNPAFDLTPHYLITAIISDKGTIYPPFKKNIKKVLCS